MASSFCWNPWTRTNKIICPTPMPSITGNCPSPSPLTPRWLSPFRISTKRRRIAGIRRCSLRMSEYWRPQTSVFRVLARSSKIKNKLQNIITIQIKMWENPSARKPLWNRVLSRVGNSQATTILMDRITREILLKKRSLRNSSKRWRNTYF